MGATSKLNDHENFRVFIFENEWFWNLWSRSKEVAISVIPAGFFFQNIDMVEGQGKVSQMGVGHHTIQWVPFLFQ